MIAGRVWIFGDSISTDFILPGPALTLLPMQQAKWVFQANRPGWVDEVQAGDIIVAGRSFGVGSSRPAARSLKNLGIACVLAETINRLFFRNCVNFGLLAFECPGVVAAFQEGQTAELSVEQLSVRNRETGAVLEAKAIPPMLIDMMQNGGIYPLLEREGIIAPKQDAVTA